MHLAVPVLVQLLADAKICFLANFQLCENESSQFQFSANSSCSRRVLLESSIQLFLSQHLRALRKKSIRSLKLHMCPFALLFHKNRSLFACFLCFAFAPPLFRFFSSLSFRFRFRRKRVQSSHGAHGAGGSGVGSAVSKLLLAACAVGPGLRGQKENKTLLKSVFLFLFFVTFLKKCFYSELWKDPRKIRISCSSRTLQVLGHPSLPPLVV